MAPFSGKPTRGFDSRASTGQRWRAFSRPVRPPKRWCRPTRRVISWCSCSSNGNGPRWAGYRRRTGRCVSHKSIAGKGATGSSCIGMLIRSWTVSAWKRRLRSLGATEGEGCGPSACCALQLLGGRASSGPRGPESTIDRWPNQYLQATSASGRLKHDLAVLPEYQVRADRYTITRGSEQFRCRIEAKRISCSFRMQSV